jgi:DNA polymerase I
MIVTESNFSAVLEEIGNEGKVSVDTETTGLKVYQEDRLFSIIVSTASEDYYFNFNNEADHLGNLAPAILPRSLIGFLIYMLQCMDKLFLANAKFDMGMIQKEYPECKIKWPEIHDVLVMDRLLFNDHISYSLENVAKRNGLAKSDAVDEYIKEHKLWEWEVVPHRKKRDKRMFFNKVPFDIISAYGCKDGRITYQLGLMQEAKLASQFKKVRETKYSPYEIETKTTQALFAMEQEGININETIAKDKGDDHHIKFELAARRFHDETRQVFIDSADTLSPLFERAGFTPPKTDKGADSITDDWLEGVNSELATLVRGLRSDLKSESFYKSYLYYKDSGGLIHANVNQSGTRTGRFSMSNPNLQQTPDSEVRRVFCAPKDFYLVSIDYQQQEYRMMLDYAEQMDLVEKVKGGLDVHEATAQLMGVERKPAKTLNFMLLYGGGVVKLAIALFKVTVAEPILWVIWKQANGWRLDADDKKWLGSITDEIVSVNLPELYKAEKLRKLYFSKLPMVEKLIDECKTTAADRGFIRTWTGRPIYFKRNFAYKAPNALIQGGASDVGKIAIIDNVELCSKRKSKLLLAVHDELIFKIHKDEKDLVYDAMEIMKNAFPSKHLPLTVDANIGGNLWDMEKYG